MWLLEEASANYSERNDDMSKLKIVVVIFITTAAVGLLVLLFSLLNKNNSDSVVVSVTSSEETVPENNFVLSTKLSDYVGSVVVGLSVNSEMLPNALAAIEDDISDENAVYIFVVNYDRDGIPYVTYTVYDSTTGKFTDKDVNIDLDKSVDDFDVIYETEETRINMRQ